MLSVRMRAALAGTVTIALLTLATYPSVAEATAAKPAAVKPAAATQKSAHVRRFDQRELSRTNHARTKAGLPRYKWSSPLYRVAHAYAEKLARTNNLAHNPKLIEQITNACPRTDERQLGENVGELTDISNPVTLFVAYMHSPEHRANILASNAYTEVGIATVQITRNGHTQQFDVMDFADHCA